MSLSEAEVAVALALYVLGGKGTAKQIAEVSGVDVQVVRNTLRRLRQKGVVKTYRAVVGGALVAPIVASVSPEEEEYRGREKVYELAIKDLETMFSKYGSSILKWARELNIESLEKLKEVLEKRREEIQKKIEEIS